VNEIVVELYGFKRKFGFCRFHWFTPAAIIPSVSSRSFLVPLRNPPREKSDARLL